MQVQAAARAVLGFPAALVRLWRRSLRVRVVAATTVLCLVVVALLGMFLVQYIRNNLLAAKRDAAFAEAGQKLTQAQDQLADLNPQDADARDQQVYDMLDRLVTRGGQAGRSELLFIASPASPQGDRVSDVTAMPYYTSGAASRDDLPPALRTAVHTADKPQWTYMAMPGADAASPSLPTLVVGDRVYLPGVGSCELYFLFPLSQESRTLHAVQRALWVAGIGLVLLVGLVAALVVRQVVTPVRMAARISERLASGDLDERMTVRGQDDLARLASSFNRMAASLQSQIHQLEELSRLQRRFVSDVSHELRTPLTTVRMAADVLHMHRERFDESMLRSSELMQNQLDQFETLLADLLEISRFDAAAALLEPEPVDLCEVVNRVAVAMLPLARQHGCAVYVDRPAGPCVAEMDSRRIERVVRNLLANAIEHGKGAPIQVRVACGSGVVAASVRDFGIGLTPEQAQRVFDRFWRADPSRARTLGGTGLGLSISLEDVHLHGGWLQAWGQPGQGALFRLTLPAAQGGEALADSPLPLEDEHGSADDPAGTLLVEADSEPAGLEAAAEQGDQS